MLGKNSYHHDAAPESSAALWFIMTTSAAMCLGTAEGLVNLWHPNKPLTVLTALSYGTFSSALCFLAARTVAAARATLPSPRAIVLLAAAASAFIALVVLRGFPSSGDEFGYLYLAQTLQHFRLWNPPLSEHFQEVFRTVNIVDLDGKRVSQYAPAWPAILAVFAWLRIPALANVALGIAVGLVMAAGLKEFRPQRDNLIALLACALLSPFLLFNDASLFNHTLSTLCVLLPAWLTLREVRAPSRWNQVIIGLAFSVQLNTRYEVFAITLLLYVADGLLKGGLRFITRSPWAVAGALPGTAIFLLFNVAVAGGPFHVLNGTGQPNGFGLYATGLDGVNTVSAVIERNGRLFTWWCEFASPGLLLIGIVAVAARTRQKNLFWFDFLLPALVVLTILYPNGGGFQYGPRYWIPGWVTLPLTIAATFGANRVWTIGRIRVSPVAFALCQLAAYVGFSATYAIYASAQVAARDQVLRVASSAPGPALVLVSQGTMRYKSWQDRPIPFDSEEFTRNGVDGLGPVAIGRYLGTEKAAALCGEFSNRSVYRLMVPEGAGTPVLTKLCLPS